MTHSLFRRVEKQHTHTNTHTHKPAGQWLVRCSVRSARQSKSCWQLSQVKMESSSKSSSPTLSSWLVTLCSPSSPAARLSFLSESRSDTAASMYIHTHTHRTEKGERCEVKGLLLTGESNFNNYFWPVMCCTSYICRCRAFANVTGSKTYCNGQNLNQ